MAFAHIGPAVPGILKTCSPAALAAGISELFNYSR